MAPRPQHARRRLALGVGAVVAASCLALGIASVDRCGEWAPAPPGLTLVARAKGPLRAGASRVAVAPDWPVAVAGYGPFRNRAYRAEPPVQARATVLEAGGQKVGVVQLDVLLIPSPLVARVRQGRDYPVWLVASHTHSSLGGFDRRPAAQWAGVGAFREQDEAALAKAATEALALAEAALTPVTLEVSEGVLAEVRARTGEAVDDRLMEVRFVAETGRAVARWILAAAHPTLVPRSADRLDPDWPGRIDAAFDAPTLVLQTNGGNASATLKTPEARAEAVTRALAGLPTLRTAGEVDLALAQVTVGLPRPDASRLVPFPFQAAARNVLCDGAPMEVELSVLRVGPVALLAVPAEPTLASGQVLEQQAGVTRVVSLANGYAGYVEPEATARAGSGEARRQYFGPALLNLLADGARLLGTATGTRSAAAP